MAYSKVLRERAIARILPPVNASLSAVSQELNIQCQTVNAWRAQSSKRQVPVTQALAVRIVVMSLDLNL
jgi:hypothetical protein